MEGRVLLLDAGTARDVFDLVELADWLARVRAAFLFEVGEQLKVSVEHDGTASEALARVRGHVGTGDDRITELERRRSRKRWRLRSRRRAWSVSIATA